jgi:sigma-B regulation protein RsbU (phosphoserine phosphatase)
MNQPFATRSRALDPLTSALSLACGEVWAANSNVAHAVELPGLRGWVYSAPVELGQNGGDIHYLSVCNSGVLCRIALVDVSGHGHAVSGVADRLLGVMRTHINHLEQRDVLHELGDSLHDMNGAERMTFATALMIGFDSSSGEVVFTNAGHPPPLWYHADERRWDWLRPASANPSDLLVGLPLGMDFGRGYKDEVIQLGVGDLLICYSDGLSEAGDGAGRQIDSAGLMALARMLPAQSPMAAGATLLGLVDEWRRGAPASDDETLIVLQRQEP